MAHNVAPVWWHNMPEAIFSIDKTALFYIPQTNRILAVETETDQGGQEWNDNLCTAVQRWVKNYNHFWGSLKSYIAWKIQIILFVNIKLAIMLGFEGASKCTTQLVPWNFDIIHSSISTKNSAKAKLNFVQNLQF